MKRSFLTKIVAVILLLTMIFSLCACGGNTNTSTDDQVTYPANGEKKVISTSKVMYAPDGNTQDFEVAYYENEEEVLLVEINYAIEQLLTEFVVGMGGGSITVDETEDAVTITRENESYCEINFVEDTIYFSDFDLFGTKAYNATPHDLLASKYTNEAGESTYFNRSLSFFTPGYAILIDLAERNIPLDIYDGKKYIPLQTFNDLFVSALGLNIAYNGESLFVIIGNSIDDEMSKKYYSKEKTLRSDVLKEFNYNELCLFLDLYYGLQSEHGFNDGFDYYLESIGLKEKFLESDAVYSYSALAMLTLGYMEDMHSVVVGASPYAGEAKPKEGVNVLPGMSVIEYQSASEKYETARQNAMGEGVQFYQKIGNTAYITFDSFDLMPRSGDYEIDQANEIIDTITLISAAHAAISNDPEIENVVLDLSCNGGGAADAAIYTVAWMLGYCNLSTYDSVTGSRSTISYLADVNFDGVFDKNDSISDKNLFCLVSPVSFSCGNLVPAILKASNEVTIIGKPSSGGGCPVHHGVTADGTIFNISSSKQLTTVKNGTYYSIDSGVEPHYTLTHVESFYDRQALTEYINGLK